MNEMIYFHLLMIDKVICLSEEALALLNEDKNNLSRALDLLEQRSTVMDIIDHVQGKIEKGLSAKMVLTDLEFSNWQQETSTKYQVIDQLDQAIVSELGDVKKQLANEISNTFNSKNSIKGYNANSVK